MAEARRLNKKGAAHSVSSGKRLHHIANMGGLVVLSGLDDNDPEVLLGGLLKLRDALSQLSSQEEYELKKIGREKLQHRKAEKRAWKTKTINEEERLIYLTDKQIKEILKRFGIACPNPKEDLIETLEREVERFKTRPKV